MAHPDFADWYRIVHLVPNSEHLDKRWQGIEQIVAKFTSEQMLNVVRLVQPDLTSFSKSEAIIQAFVEADSTFPKRGNETELQVLGASAIIALLTLKQPDCKKDAVALAMVCSRYAETRQLPLIEEAYKSAVKHLRAEGEQVRKLYKLSSVEAKAIAAISVKKLQLAREALTAEESAENIIALNTVLVEDINGVRTTLSQALKEVTENQKLINSNYQIVNEETEVLWWLMGEWSRELDCPYTELSPHQACLYVGKELADITQLLPGPSSAKHLMNKMLQICRDREQTTTTLQQVVNATPLTWRTSCLQAYSPSVATNTCPILLAIQKSLDTDGDEDWLPVYQKSSRLDATAIISPFALAWQMYLECLLVRTLGL